MAEKETPDLYKDDASQVETLFGALCKQLEQQWVFGGAEPDSTARNQAKSWGRFWQYRRRTKRLSRAALARRMKIDEAKLVMFENGLVPLADLPEDFTLWLAEALQDRQGWENFRAVFGVSDPPNTPQVAWLMNQTIPMPKLQV